MAFDAYIKIDGIPGESTDDKHKDWIEILNYGFGASQPTSGTASSAGGASTGRVNIQDFTFTHFLDKASPKLFEAVCTGKHFSSVTVELCRAGGDKLKYMEYKLSDVVVSSLGRGGDAKGEEDVPIESASLNFGKIVMTYTQQKRKDGSGGGNVAFGWDLTTNKSAS
jgi:type VI secretion system secreted protein Hcp